VPDQVHVERLKKGVREWNKWRENASHSDLIGIDLRQANLRGANLRGANLSKAVLSGAHLGDVSLVRANLNRADLRRADLRRTVLRGANLYGADLTEATLYETVFSNVDLTGVIGLETCQHKGPSVIDHRTLQLSSPLPLRFLRGVGLPDQLIDYLPSLFDRAVQYYSCFISYSAKDQSFADRIHADLQNKGVRCWFAPHDLPIGAKILDGIDEAIRLRDKMLLILSTDAIESDWVENEVTTAFEEERKRGRTVLFPIRLDDEVMMTKEAWAAQLRARHIGDFRHWKEHEDYKRSFERILRDLAAKPKIS
jgi:uncharacterized protein YjbI with pentapeptide repeats